MEKERFYNLVHKYFSGELSETEQLELDELLKKASYAELFKSYANLNRRIAAWSYTPPSKEKKEKLLSEILNLSTQKGKVRRLPTFVNYAAVLLILLGVGLAVIDRSPQTATQDKSVKKGVSLRLSDTLIKSLKSNSHGTLGILQGVEVKQLGDTVKYIATGEANTESYSEIDVPYGETAVLVLSDSTRITLNSGTWLKFPHNVTSGSTREVYLKGEAFFEVSRDTSRPFVVRTDEVGVRVLGTSFNVSNYPSDSVVSTVLVEGKVALYKAAETYDEEKALLIKPGTLAEFDNQGEYLRTKTVDTERYTAWKDGAMIFEGADFASIIHSLERKFDVRIENHNKQLEKEIFTAKFYGEPLPKVLQSFQRSYPFEYTIEGNTVIIN
ncbi:FecR family protein [Sinomicrobium sp.]